LRQRDKITDVVENIMLGTYGVKPLSVNVASDAVKYLNNQRIELDDKIIVIVVNEGSGTIEFRVEPKKVVEEVKEKPSAVGPAVAETVSAGPIKPPVPERTIQQASLELPPGFDVDDVRQRLTALINLLKELDAEVTALELRLDSESLSLHMMLKKLAPEVLGDSNVKAVMNLLSRLSKAENKAVSMGVHLSKPVAEDNVRGLLGEYLKVRRSSFDRYLPA